MIKRDFITKQPIKSEQLGCLVNAFTHIRQVDEKTINMECVHIPIYIYDRREVVVSSVEISVEDYPTWVSVFEKSFDEITK